MGETTETEMAIARLEKPRLYWRIMTLDERQALRHLIAEARKCERVRDEAYKAACSKSRDHDPDSQAWQAGYRALGRELGLILSAPDAETKEVTRG